MIDRHSIETAYCFFHQKHRVYVHSTLEWQRDDIEYAIASYSENMNPELYAFLAQGRAGFLRRHDRFTDDLEESLASMQDALDKQVF